MLHRVCCGNLQSTTTQWIEPVPADLEFWMVECFYFPRKMLSIFVCGFVFQYCVPLFGSFTAFNFREKQAMNKSRLNFPITSRFASVGAWWGRWRISQEPWETVCTEWIKYRTRGNRGRRRMSFAYGSFYHDDGWGRMGICGERVFQEVYSEMSSSLTSRCVILPVWLRKCFF